MVMGGSAVIQGGAGRRGQTVIGGNVSVETMLPGWIAWLVAAGSDDTHATLSVNYNNKGSGACVLRLASEWNTNFAYLMLIPLARAVWDRVTAKEEGDAEEQ